MPPEVLGPVGLTIGLLVALSVLWREHVRSDEDDRKQRDIALEGWRAQTEATKRLADAIEKRNRADAERRRAGDQ